MSTWDTASKIEDIAISLWGVSCLVVALQDAMFHGTFAPQTYEGAMFALQEGIEKVESDARSMADQLYKKAQEGE